MMDSTTSFISFYQLLMIVLGMFSLELITNYFIFRKMDIEPWKGLIPFYNSFLYYKTFYRSGWVMLLVFFPFVGIWFAFGLLNRLGKGFNKSLIWRIALPMILSPIGKLILAFGHDEFDWE